MPKPYQRLSAFADKIVEILSAGDKALLQNGDTQSEGMRDCARRLCQVLLNYCSYRIGSILDHDINPFDDPFVGAALLNGNGEVISGHRKEGRNEPHAEVETLLGALNEVASQESEKLAARIRSGLEDKVWLRSAHAEREFVRLFEEAGHVVRHKNGGGRLLLISTLEPCRDFESQPSCSRLISAFKPNLVVYGCDDTNAKGQGRPILQEYGVNIIWNVACQLNVDMNVLFYAAVHYLNKIHTHSLESQSGFEVSYVIANLDRLNPKAVVDEKTDRVRVVFDEPIRLPVHLASIEPRAPRGDDELYPGVADPTRVLFINSLTSDFLSRYVHRHLAATRGIPGIIVCPQGENDGVRDDERPRFEAFLTKLKSVGTRVYTNVLRKSDEQFLALQSILRFDEHVDPEGKIYIFVKEGGDQYKNFSGKAHEIAEQLLPLQQPRRASVYCARSAVQSFKALVHELEARAFNNDEHPLSRCSFQVFVVAETVKDAESGVTEIEALLQQKGLSHRFLLGCRTQEAIRPQSAAMLHELISGRLDPIGLPKLESLLEGPTWKDRQAAGLFLVGAAEQDPALYRDLIASRIPREFDQEQWKPIIARLNAVAKYGPPHNSSDSELIQNRLEGLAQGLEEVVQGNKTSELLDVVWRYIAAVVAIAEKPNQLAMLLHGKRLREYIANSSFLLKELFFYVHRVRQERDGALQLAFDILEDANLSDAECLKVSQRITRLFAVWGINDSSFAKKRFEKFLRRFPSIEAACRDEAARCEFVKRHHLSGIFRINEDQARRFATYLFLRTARSGGGEQGLFTAVGREIDQAISKPQEGKVPRSWRGDRTSLARLALSEVEPSQIHFYLDGMAEDEDESVKWAALVLAMDFEIRQRILGNQADKRACLDLRYRTSAILAKMIDHNCHYWLKREFIHCFENDHSAGNLLPLSARLQVDDVPAAKSLLCGDGTGEHAEVQQELQRLRRRLKHVLLVLPPLALDETPLPTNKSTTPPLGLGSIGSVLRSHGHNVELLDCHRFPELTNMLPEKARGRHVLGFNVVTSSFAATKELVARLKNSLRENCPIIVLGGHAVTLHPNEFVQHRTFLWDYLVLGDGERPLLEIVEHGAAAVVSTSGIVHQSARPAALPVRADLKVKEWDALPWVDHSIYRGPDGKSYEPSSSRNGKCTEAHVVMSRGCAWKCSFCTEAILRGNDGEVRRSARDVVEEINFLIERAGANHVQFIDDNLLPQIGSERVDQTSALAWATTFLNGLTEITSRYPDFAWRGIFRFEDFLEYQRQYSDWIRKLKSAGCMLLAFGVEHGSEERRRKLKAGSVSNQEISDVVKCLTDQGIATKGYFIVGGEKENQETTSDSINLAVSAGFTLAYFALYKDFRKLVQRSMKGIGTAQERERRFMRFNSLEADFEVRIRNLQTSDDCLTSFGMAYDEERIAEAKQAIENLATTGFRFQDLFKYNDYHDGLDDADGVLSVWSQKNNENATQSFLCAVRRAYFEFYAREAFVKQYRWLIERGY